MLNFVTVLLSDASPTVVRLYNLVDYFSMKAPLGSAAWYLVYLVGALACVVVPYLLGSINPAILISKTIYHEDIRNFGSGNAGTTNMLRTYGKKAALATFLLDLAKAALACFFGLLVWEMNGLGLAGFFVVFGHMYPIFEKFKGGKGVACLTVVALITSIFTNNWIVPFVPFTFLFLLFAFVMVVVATRYVSMASVICALIYPVLLHSLSGPNAGICVAMAVLSACFVVYKHKENLKRIYERRESQISFRKTDKRAVEKPSGEEEQS
ncbi:MAG: glycerol-3-phosphate 1-O-acyltransferase PlsY [Ruminococcaceae bacterium]|nr:glycerol-3-phosphate 1-O-acyltransferase PlsY [Oscillospiraceae bacterium]